MKECMYMVEEKRETWRDGNPLKTGGQVGELDSGIASLLVTKKSDV